ncbi:hypothetical protein SAMN05880501_11294 [Ureibacillus xyleni]|uniref:Uncharacterized protein n=1 Tax=Ureibacillus xyleni TaxID=614648 RepID=A0A285TFZ9_9BACL|nr:hypothetical protein [Ureibacillus xyleni]SOC21003.1 hypothetical protein SAMN05880501_11294 [Ureibacillus xyleni]
MQKLPLLLLASIFLFLLTGCTDQLTDIKKAVSEIDSSASKAANAISKDAHTIRAIEIEYNNEVFSINDLFESILRDIQWEYENFDELQKLKVKGTWKEGLFESYHFSEAQKSKLITNGKVTVEFEIVDQQISSDSAVVKLILEKELLVDEKGIKALELLYDSYLSK